jgi:predicted Fe-Mo cluster-binding NifX family protein
MALSAETNNGLDSITSQHFGRCPYFIFVDLDGIEVKGVSSVANPFFKQHGPG